MKAEDKVIVKKLKTIAMISLLFMCVQLVGGYFANSVAIFADAFHMLSDVIAYIISLMAVLLSHKVAPPYMAFGYEKVQPLGALVSIAIIWFVTFELFLEATHRIFAKEIVTQPLFMLLTSVFGLFCNLVIMKILHSDPDAMPHHHCSHSHGDQHQHSHKHNHNHEAVPKYPSIGTNEDEMTDREKPLCAHDHSADHAQHKKKVFANINIQAAYIHIISDIILSIGVIISAIIIFFLGDKTTWNLWQLADPLCTYLFSFMAIYTTLPILKQSTFFLLDASEDHDLVYDIKNGLNAIRGVKYDLKVWSSNRGKNYAMVYLTIDASQCEVSAAKSITSKVFEDLEVRVCIDIEVEKQVTRETLNTNTEE